MLPISFTLRVLFTDYTCMREPELQVRHVMRSTCIIESMECERD